MKSYNTIKVKGKEFWWRIYGYNGGRKLEIIFNPEKLPEHHGVIHNLGFWIYPKEEILDMVKGDCLEYIKGSWDKWIKELKEKHYHLG